MSRYSARLMALLGSLWLWALAATAAATDFDFATGPGVATRHNSLSFTSDGITVTITPTHKSTKVSYYWEGLGAYSTSVDLDTFDDCCVGLNDDDGLVFSFSQPVTISEIGFRQWENGFDRVTLTVNGVTHTLNNSNRSISAGLIDYFNFPTSAAFTSFTLRATNDSGTANYIHSLLSTIPAPDHIQLSQTDTSAIAADNTETKTVTVTSCSNAGASSCIKNTSDNRTITVANLGVGTLSTTSVTLVNGEGSFTVKSNTVGSAQLKVSASTAVNGYSCTRGGTATTGTDTNADCQVNFAGLDHVELVHDGQGTVCGYETITLKACADASCSSLYTGSTSFTLADNSAAATLSNAAPSFSGGTASVSLHNSASGTVRISAGGTPAWACRNGATNTTTACDISFSGSGSISFNVADTEAAKPQTVTVQALRSNPATLSCEPAIINSTRSIDFWYAYSNPASGSQAVSINGASIGQGAGNKTAVSLSFDASGNASISVNYADAGQMTLDASFSGTDHNGQSLSLAGPTDSWISRPYGFCVRPTSMSPNCSSESAAGVACQKLMAAGDPFDIQVRAIVWEADVDLNKCDNATTPNFSANGVPMDALLMVPSGGTTGSLGITSIDIPPGGEATVSGQTYSEAGEIRLRAGPVNYLGGPQVSIRSSTRTGIFYPKYFSISNSNAPILQSGWLGNFTYRGQPFSLDQGLTIEVTAQNAAGATTLNYDANELWQLDEANLTPSYSSNHTGADLSPVTASSPSENAGLALDGKRQYSFAETTFSYDRALPITSADAPFAADFTLQLAANSLTTADGTCLDDNHDGNCEAFNHRLTNPALMIRFGRLHLHSASGPENGPVNLSIAVEYWNGSSWASASDDTATQLTPANLAVIDNTSLSGSLDPGESSASFVDADHDNLFLDEDGNGAGFLQLSAPGIGNGGRATVSVTGVSDWLKYDWNNDGNLTDDPSADVVFGAHGDSQMIFYQEVISH